LNHKSPVIKNLAGSQNSAVFLSWVTEKIAFKPKGIGSFFLILAPERKNNRKYLMYFESGSQVDNKI
jgi:hypothetical protein